jgi:hypothetical protein
MTVFLKYLVAGGIDGQKVKKLNGLNLDNKRHGQIGSAFLSDFIDYQLYSYTDPQN